MTVSLEDAKYDLIKIFRNASSSPTRRVKISSIYLTELKLMLKKLGE